METIDKVSISVGHLDNRRSVNLRIATQQQNSWNQKRHSNNTSGFRGVDWNARSGKWRARITVGWDTINLGLYSTPRRHMSPIARQLKTTTESSLAYKNVETSFKHAKLPKAIAEKMLA